MNLEEQVISLDYARKLALLGVKQESIFKFSFSMINARKDCYDIVRHTSLEIMKGDYSAFTTNELFDILPAVIDTKKDEPFNKFHMHLVKRNIKNIEYILNYYCDTQQYKKDGDPFFLPNLIQNNIYDEKLPDALAKLLIALIEMEYVKYEK